MTHESRQRGLGPAYFNEDPDITRDRLAAIVRSADDAIYSKDTNGIVVSWNRGAERLYGYTEAEIVGRSISLLVPTERAGEEREILRRILNGGELSHYETNRVTRDGRIIEVSVSASPIHASDGSIVGASLIARDITDVKRTRKAVGRLAAIIEGSDDAIYSKDTQAIVDSWNPAAQRLYGYTAEEAIGRHVRFLVPLDRKGEETEILHRICSGERIEHFETQRVTKSGDLVDVSITVSPIRNEKAQVIGASVIARDIRDRKRLEELQRTLDRTDFITRAAHELRNPISTLVGFATLLSDDSGLSGEQRAEIVQGVARQGERVAALIRDLLDLSYVESGRYQMNMTDVALEDVVNDVLTSMERPEGKDVTVDIPTGSIVSADPARLGQVFANLLSNAYKYGGNRISIVARSHDDRVVIEVADNGPGVPDHVRSTLFEPFVRGHSGTNGTGLGLAITSRLVEVQGGEIRLDPSRGSCFVMQLSAGRSGS